MQIKNKKYTVDLTLKQNLKKLKKILILIFIILIICLLLKYSIPLYEILNQGYMNDHIVNQCDVKEQEVGRPSVEKGVEPHDKTEDNDVEPDDDELVLLLYLMRAIGTIAILSVIISISKG
jgi:hypothetical protein